MKFTNNTPPPVPSFRPIEVTVRIETQEEFNQLEKLAHRIPPAGITITETFQQNFIARFYAVLKSAL